MRRSATIWIGTVLCASALAACGSSSEDPPSTTGTTAAGAETAGATATEESLGGGAAGGGAAGGAAAYSDAEACDWLKENLPKWDDITSEVGVQAQLAIGLASFFEEHGGLENADGYAYDEATSRACPEEHDAAVKKAGIETFGNL